ncbi:hypothetical protein WJX84_011030 [Apatococcus fuscideae]|uniref:Nicotinamide phosphoribosyltransferase n=1 Tax=Apatococcus fuscideae TaxID=2026836 RepID=A0AAW1T929_9CHLO
MLASGVIFYREPAHLLLLERPSLSGDLLSQLRNFPLGFWNALGRWRAEDANKMSMGLKLPLAVLTDSYKATHYLQYPPSSKMVAYGEFRSGYNRDKADTRLVFHGMRYLVENYLSRQWTETDVTQADAFFRTHMAPSNSKFPFPRDMFMKFVHENEGYFPVKLECLPEGTCIHPHVPVYQITSEGEYACLCTFMETLLTMVWYPTTVATLSRRCRDLLERAFEKTVDLGKDSPLLGSRLHDFGFRGCTCLEQSILGGTAHLLNFDGTDTMSAAYYAQFVLNNGVPVASSVPATEHSVMTAWATEKEAIDNMLEHFGSGFFSCVMDSYDYAKALSEVLPAVAAKKTEKGGYMILRPDSGDPLEAVLAALRAAEKVFGVDINKKGFKVPRGCGVIQGDGIDYDSLSRMLDGIIEAGFSIEATAFGMGGGLMQRVNRDTMSFATKLSHIVYQDGTTADLMKAPKSDPSKASLPGILAVKRVDGVPTAFPADDLEMLHAENLLQVVYDGRPAKDDWEDFTGVRQRVAQEWSALPKSADVISSNLRKKMAQIAEDRRVSAEN